MNVTKDGCSRVHDLLHYVHDRALLIDETRIFISWLYYSST